MDGCIGIVVHDGACLGHLGDQLDDYLDGLRPGDALEARGAVVTAVLVNRVLDRVKYGRTVPGTIALEHAEIIGDDSRFELIDFNGDVSCSWARFAGSVRFNHSRFHQHVSFDNATFASTAQFENVQVTGELRFVNARFEKRARFGPLRASGLDLDGVRCAAMTEIDVQVERLTCRRARFEEGVVIRANDGAVFVEQARFGAPSLISGIRVMPRLSSLRQTEVNNLELADVDLRLCVFAGAYRLDQLRLAGRCPFDRPPRGWWTRRRTIVEEHVWRKWPTDRPDYWHLYPADPERMANVYRSLRKAFEDSKFEAGAGDFYYGEMEMRRHSAETPHAERWILTVYWLLSGYGQRAARAIAALVLVIVVVGVLLALWGQPAGDAARIAVGAVVLREPGAELTEAGQWTVMVARVLGPVLLALAVLAVRARVKR